MTKYIFIMLLLLAKISLGQSYIHYDFSSFNGPGEWVTNGSNIGSVNGNMSFNVNGSLANNSTFSFTSPNINFSSDTQGIYMEYELDINLRNAYWGDLFSCWCLRYDDLKIDYLDIGGWQTAVTHTGNVSGTFSVSIPNSTKRLRFILETDAGSITGRYAEVMEMSLDQSVSLPVELSDFQLQKQNSTALISWTTSTEINNSHFVIERSSAADNFVLLGKVDGLGNSSTGKKYFFEDESPIMGYNYYRLKQVDFNGNSEIFETKALFFDLENEDGSISIYPIPARDQLTIVLAEIGEGELLIKNQMGVLMKKQYLLSGMNQVEIGELNAGNYIISLIMDSKIIHKKIILL